MSNDSIRGAGGAPMREPNEAGIRAAERRKVVEAIAAELAEHLQWQRDTGCHKMTGTPEIGRYIGMEDAWNIVRKFGEVTT